MQRLLLAIAPRPLANEQVVEKAPEDKATMWGVATAGPELFTLGSDFRGATTLILLAWDVEEANPWSRFLKM